MFREIKIMEYSVYMEYIVSKYNFLFCKKIILTQIPTQKFDLRQRTKLFPNGGLVEVLSVGATKSEVSNSKLFTGCIEMKNVSAGCRVK